MGLRLPLVFTADKVGESDGIETDGTRAGRLCRVNDGDGGSDCVEDDACSARCETLDFTRRTEDPSSLEMADRGGDSAVRLGVCDAEVDTVKWDEMLPLRERSTCLVEGSAAIVVTARCRSSGSEGAEAMADALLRASPVTLALTGGTEEVGCGPRADLNGDGARTVEVLLLGPEERLEVAGGDTTFRVVIVALVLTLAFGLELAAVGRLVE